MAGVSVAPWLPDGAGATGPQGRLEFPFYPQVQSTYTPEDIRDILNILMTMEHSGAAVKLGNLSGAIGPKINPVQVSNQQASLVINLARVDFLEPLGGHALTDT